MSVWEAISPLVGVALGWGLTQASSWLGTRQADRRVIKEALYALLELYGLLNVLGHLNALLPQVAALIRKHAPAAPLPEYEADIDRALTGVLHGALLPFVGQRLTDLKAEYAASLQKLAAVDPVSAYRLRGQPNILDEVPQFAAHWQKALGTYLGEPVPDMPETVAHLRHQMEMQQVAETYKLVRQVVRQLAGQLDRRTRRRVAELLAKPAPSGPALLAGLEGQIRRMRAALP